MRGLRMRGAAKTREVVKRGRRRSERDSDKPQYTPNFECFSDGGCMHYFAVWAVGGLPFSLPPAAGMPLGLGGYQRLVLQIHYTNPQGLSTVVDNSGMFLRISPTLRQYDAGVLDVGPNIAINIPAQQPAWTQETVCPEECTQRLGNSSDGTGSNITIFASLMHQHLAGKQLFTDVYRNGTKLLTTGRQDYYDFAFQQFKDLTPGFYLLPGDELRTRCVWDTTDRTNVTLGGFATVDEMCINYFLYYPAKQSFFGSCFNFCAPQDGATGPLVEMLACGADVMTKNATCPADYFGNNRTAFETVAGCTDRLLPSLDSLQATAVSVVATSAPNTGNPPPHSASTRLSTVKPLSSLGLGLAALLLWL